MKNVRFLLFVIIGLVFTSFSFNNEHPTFSKECISEKTSVSGNTITILFAYTTKAAMEVGGPKNIKKNVVNGMRQLNEALVNNNIGYRAEMIPEFVHLKDNSDNTADIITELNNVDGDYCEIHKFRKQKQADIICLIFEGGRTSKGMLGGEVMVVTAKGAWDGSYIFPHEFGHVMGCKHEGGYLVHDFGSYPYPYRTISNNGGVSLPYFSENRIINHTIDGVTKQIKIGDASHDNAAIMRKNAPAKSRLGENLPTPSACNGKYAAELVNPDNAPSPPGTKTPFEMNAFTWNKTGQVTMKWEASEEFAKTYPRYKIKYFDEKDQPNNWLGSRNGFINPGRPYDGTYTTYRPDKITIGSRIELWIQFEDGGEYEKAAYSIIGGKSEILIKKPEEEEPAGPVGGIDITTVKPNEQFSNGDKVCVDGNKNGTIHSHQGNGHYFVTYQVNQTQQTEPFHSSRLTDGSCATVNSGTGPSSSFKKGDKVCIKGEINGEVADWTTDGFVAVGYGYDNVFVIEWFKESDLKSGNCINNQTGKGYIGPNGQVITTTSGPKATQFVKGDKVCVDGIFEGEVTNVPSELYVSVYYAKGNMQVIDLYSPDRLTKGTCAPGANNGVEPGNSGGTSLTLKGNTLHAGQSLSGNEALNDGAHTAVMQTNGNFGLYQNGKIIQWATGTNGSGTNGRLIMQTDGNLVLYVGSGIAVWSSQTHPYWDSKYNNPEWKPVKLVLENGLLILYSATGKAVWSSKIGDGAGAGVVGKPSTSTSSPPALTFKVGDKVCIMGKTNGEITQIIDEKSIAVGFKSGTGFSIKWYPASDLKLGSCGSSTTNDTSTSTNNGGNGDTGSGELPAGYGNIKDNIECQGREYCRNHDNTLFMKRNGQWEFMFVNIDNYSCRFTPGKAESARLIITQLGNKYSYDANTGKLLPVD